MNIAWFFQDDTFNDEDVSLFKDEVLKQGYTVLSGYDFDPSYSSQYDLIIYYGSLQLARKIYNKYPNVVIYCTFDNYECTKYYAYLGGYLLNKDYMMIPFSEFPRMRKLIFSIFGKDGKVFVRPSSGEKTFTGQLVRSLDFDADYKTLNLYDVSHHAMIIISSPKKIIREWRLVVCDGKVITGSLYNDATMNLDYKLYPTEVQDLATQVLAVGYEPDVVWSLDLCETDDGKYHLLEIGGFSCAGMYEGDYDIIVRCNRN